MSKVKKIKNWLVFLMRLSWENIIHIFKLIEIMIDIYYKINE